MRCSVLGIVVPALLAASLWHGVALKLPTAEEDPRYNPATVVDITGIVEDIREVVHSPLSGLHLVFSTDARTIDVYLGPTGFVKEFESLFTRKSRIRIIGSKVKCGSSDVILARELNRHESTLYLRDKQGRPLWDTI